MIATRGPGDRPISLRSFKALITAATFCIAGAGSASAFVGDDFLQIAGVNGGYPGGAYKNWIKTTSHYWTATPDGIFSTLRSRRAGAMNRSVAGASLYYSGPLGPRKGASSLVVAVDKHSPALKPLMDRCANKAKIPEIKFAESAAEVRPNQELGKRPAEIPEYFEYKLTDVTISDCPVVADAPEQALVVGFSDIEVVNYRGEEGQETTLEPAVLPPLKSSGKTKTFVVTWFHLANDVSDDQCPVMNDKPSEADYYALVAKEAAAKERAELATKGGVNYQNEQMAHRGPNKVNACQLPGIVRDPGFFMPQTKVARGLDLDGNDGAGPPPASSCKHKNFSSTDGRQRGIDNQLYAVQGCLAAYQGHKGFLGQYANEQMRNGTVNMLIYISGIDDEKNDSDVDVSVFYTNDPVAKTAAGTEVLSNYTFTISTRPENAAFFRRFHGKIADGVITTERIPDIRFNMNLEKDTVRDVGMRLEILADGTLKGVFGGYLDWRHIMSTMGYSSTESNHRYQCPAVYQAFKRLADGLKNPLTGECEGVSAAYDVEGVQAFIAPEQIKGLLAQADMTPARSAKR